MIEMCSPSVRSQSPSWCMIGLLSNSGLEGSSGAKADCLKVVHDSNATPACRSLSDALVPFQKLAVHVVNAPNICTEPVEKHGKYHLIRIEGDRQETQPSLGRASSVHHFLSGGQTARQLWQWSYTWYHSLRVARTDFRYLHVITGVTMLGA
jgi:hypothetical protein